MWMRPRSRSRVLGSVPTEAPVARLAIASFADILENRLGYKEEGVALTDGYIRDVVPVRELIEGKATRIQ
jgi:hypothetical protein